MLSRNNPKCTETAACRPIFHNNIRKVTSFPNPNRQVISSSPIVGSILFNHLHRAGGEAINKPAVAGVHANQRLNLAGTGKADRRNAKASNRHLGNPAVRHYRGASGNATLVEM